MKVLLRNTRTGLFYIGPEQWTREPSEAANFEGPDRALDRIEEAELPAMEVVIHFEDTRFDIPLTIINSGK